MSVDELLRRPYLQPVREDFKDEPLLAHEPSRPLDQTRVHLKPQRGSEPAGPEPCKPCGFSHMFKEGNEPGRTGFAEGSNTFDPKLLPKNGL